MLFRSTTVVQGFPAVNSFYTESPETPRDFPSFPDTDPQGEGGVSTPSGITFPPPQLVPQGEGGVTPSGFLPPFPVLREVSGLSSYTCISKVQKLLSILISATISETPVIPYFWIASFFIRIPFSFY